MSEPRAIRSQSYIFKRYIWLMSLLYDNRSLSYEEISQKWMHSSVNQDDDRKPLPKRTFHDHIDAIADIFGVNITNQGKGDYKYFIENVDDLGKDVMRNWMLSNFSISNALSDSSDIRNRIFLQDIPSSKRWLSNIINAIREKAVIQIEYHSFTAGKIRPRDICPFFVKLYDNRWYVYARTEEDPTMKQYALDRMDCVTVLDKHFDFEPTAENSSAIQNSFGHQIYDDIKPQKILIKATDSAAKYLETLPLHNSQKRIKEVDEDGNKYVIFEYFFSPTPEFEVTLRKWGNQLERINN